MVAVINKKAVIGKSISFISNRHKPYFEVDENNAITSYKRSICIDRVELKVRLAEEDIEEFTSMFRYHIEHDLKPNGYNLITYVMDLSEQFGVYIKIQPFIKSKVNAVIQLQSKFTNNLQGNSPYILDLLNRHKWFITRLDVAFDYKTPFNTSAYLRRHGGQKQKNYDTSSWAGSMRNYKRTANDSHYDRKAENESLDSRYTNRFEVKLNFLESDNMTFSNLNHSLIANRLRAEMFIPCLKYSYFYERKVKTNRGQKGFIDLIKRSKKVENENYVKLLLSDSQWKTFRKHFKACRDDIEDWYLQNSHVIYDFLLRKEN
ncbi:hypothetical protein DVB69_04290 [Sporosarcina sp. BI001-red]|uniref:hypothetical protein n=1 Tax=Sporosarcina sp. BI001-red TaxID=2282866 RepID=UPI000E21DC55|nr:hypothetical protein [Sporosarcina sp. BI001-red]REB10032.1 hypothetical protein DVB69_04290 [Sporosarcina sp. BI001-red]